MRTNRQPLKILRRGEPEQRSLVQIVSSKHEDTVLVSKLEEVPRPIRTGNDDVLLRAEVKTWGEPNEIEQRYTKFNRRRLCGITDRVSVYPYSLSRVFGVFYITTSGFCQHLWRMLDSVELAVGGHHRSWGLNVNTTGKKLFEVSRAWKTERFESSMRVNRVAAENGRKLAKLWKSSDDEVRAGGAVVPVPMLGCGSEEGMRAFCAEGLTGFDGESCVEGADENMVRYTVKGRAAENNTAVIAYKVIERLARMGDNWAYGISGLRKRVLGIWNKYRVLIENCEGKGLWNGSLYRLRSYMAFDQDVGDMMHQTPESWACIAIRILNIVYHLTRCKMDHSNIDEQSRCFWMFNSQRAHEAFEVIKQIDEAMARNVPIEELGDVWYACKHGHEEGLAQLMKQELKSAFNNRSSNGSEMKICETSRRGAEDVENRKLYRLMARDNPNREGAELITMRPAANVGMMRNLRAV
jgi:hypothetical protein